jgi:hypothetical protein
MITDKTDKKKLYTAATRADTRQLSGHFPTEVVQAFRILAARQDKDVQQLLAESINRTLKRAGMPERAPVTSGRRKHVESPEPK